MTDDQHGEGTPQGRGRWDPLPQGDYDDGATAFVKLPEGGIDALLASSDTPLAARGHGYVPPQIAFAPGSAPDADPATAGGWPVAGAPAEGAQWPDPNAAPQDQGSGQFAYNPGATQQWNFSETSAGQAGQEAVGAPGHDVTGQWSIPVADGDLPDESGEFTTSSLVEQWGGTPPATLPGGAPAPWATQAAGQPWGEQAEAAAATGEALGTVPRPGRPADAGHAPGRPGPHAGDQHAVHPGDQPGVRPAPNTHEQPPAAAGFGPGGNPPAAPGADTHARVHPGSAARAAEEQAHASAPVEDPAESASAASQAAPGAGEPATDAQGATEAAQGPEEASVESAPAEGGDSAEETAGAAASDGVPAPPGEEHPLASYVLRVNGADRPVSDAWIGESLLYVLRERLGLAGAKDGCSQGECGACNVQVDGRLVASCLVPAVTAAGAEVRTVEGLAQDGQPSDVQRALARCGAVQCGFCVPGMAMTVHDLLEGNPAPTELETRQALCGNLCRCSGYRGVVDAVQEVVAEREAQATADEPEHGGDEPRIPHQAGPGAGGVNPSAFDPPGARGPHDQAYGPDGGQA
ncbi:Aerobic-type carbon monoxide dehydrogenase, small subunit, CoxS/CutS family [Streptomyces sp. cf386]|uniref:2Fe-2S iron-sulfur cluster-binding protein n=1 Tax=Streptomyces sp. cf386 TaxID=1761904 RepID=UPI00087F8116|nr:2Fe-2S iron-sulfur cluster-binding protein [Streptomyces sp. cf386]SDP45783.1 Aerobic-type carbon monoxide dehydrogenase, small subunit, CoxS/CutS family [Streptomyces sp. cf386]